MSPQALRWALLAFAISAGLVLIAWGVVAWRRHLRRRRRLMELVTSIAPDWQRDVLVPDGAGGWYHVDFLLRTAIGIVILDVRDVRGAVFGGEHLGEWTVMDGNIRRTFPNPLETLYDRIAAVRAVVGDDVPVEGRVLLLARAHFAKGAPPRTLLLEQLSTLAPPAQEAADLYVTAWRELQSRTEPTPRELRRRG